MIKTILKEKQRNRLKNFYEDTMKGLSRTKERKKNAETNCALELEIDAPEIEKLYYFYYFIPISGLIVRGDFVHSNMLI